MTDEDIVAAKLKGYTCLIKFRDGEELLIKVDQVGNDNEESGWFSDVEKFINGTEEYFDCFPVPATECRIHRWRRATPRRRHTDPAPSARQTI